MTVNVLRSVNGSEWAGGAPLIWPAFNTQVTRIVIGRLRDGDAPAGRDAVACRLARPLPGDLRDRYPNLRQLCLWGVDNVISVPQLPEHLVALDIRNCPELTQLQSLPRTLDDVLLRDCPKLSDVAVFYPDNLLSLALQKCPSVPQEWIRQRLIHAPKLQRLDLSGCGQLLGLNLLPQTLLDLRLNDCANLSALPEYWPERLRRLELRHVQKVRSLPDFPAESQPEFLDLRWSQGIAALPAQLKLLLQKRQGPRTLYLFGSQLTVPPASEHGTNADENVAQQTMEYFEYVQKLGEGTANRAKLLVLGNGNAGKTLLTANLIGQADAYRRKKSALQPHESISTHGVQFQNYPEFQSLQAGRYCPTQLQIWDFGGQEIYHNTHRLFISRGSVFLVVWDPAEASAAGALTDCQLSAKAVDSLGPIDYHRPLKYWLDLILYSCDGTPEIQLVCSRQTEGTAELETYWKSQLPESLQSAGTVKCFYVESWEEQGQLAALQDQLQVSVGDLLQREGAAVAADWEQAQKLVETLLQDGQQQNATMPFNEFHERLQQHLRPLLKVKLKGQRLSEDRTRQTLRYLTRIGWVYWDPELQDQQVIIGQKWALDGLYTLLQRDVGIYGELKRSGGRFTLSELHKWGWKNPNDQSPYSHKQQQLLLSFMERCGLCFLLYEAARTWDKESVYLSFEHLPNASELDLQHHFDAQLPDLNLQSTQIERPRLHKLDWQRFLMDFGREYGAAGDYASDALRFQTTDGQSVLIQCQLNMTQGFGGTLTVQTAGPAAGELLNEVVQRLHTLLPETQQRERQESRGQDNSPVAAEKINRQKSLRVFISYAWNEQKTDGQKSDDIEAPVEQMMQMLEKAGCHICQSTAADTGAVKIYRDKTRMRHGDSIVKYMQKAGRVERFVLVHSDRYWKSPHCMYELWLFRKEMGDRRFPGRVFTIGLADSHIDSPHMMQSYRNFWQSAEWMTPAKLEKHEPFDERSTAQSQLSSLIRFMHGLFKDAIGLRRKWGTDGTAALADLRKWLDLPEEVR